MDIKTAIEKAVHEEYGDGLYATGVIDLIMEWQGSETEGLSDLARDSLLEGGDADLVAKIEGYINN